MDWRLFFLDAARWIDFVEGTFLSIYIRGRYILEFFLKKMDPEYATLL